MRCPRCGSENVSSIVDTKTHTKGLMVEMLVVGIYF